MKMEQSIPERRYMKFKRRGITQKEIRKQNTEKILKSVTQVLFGTHRDIT